MSESMPSQSERSYQPAHPITELVTDISDGDVALLTDIAGYDHKLTTISAELRNVMPWAQDEAFLHPHRTAVQLRGTSIDTYHMRALQLANRAARSGIAYRVSSNPRIYWMARLTDEAIATVNQDRVYRDRRERQTYQPNEPVLYHRMQSRLMMCLAWMAEGRPMETRKMGQEVVRQRMAEAAMYGIV
jgi:hypothetical protein